MRNRRKVKSTKKTKKQLLDLIYTTRIEADAIREDKLRELREAHATELNRVIETLRQSELDKEAAEADLKDAVAENDEIKEKLKTFERAELQALHEHQGYRKAVAEIMATTIKGLK